MKFLKFEELKIFLTFFILYSLFIHWVGWNEDTRLLAAISIIEKNTLDINAYANFTGDRILVNGKYYSDKAPGISLFLSPIYFIFKVSFRDEFGNNKYVLVPQPQFNTTVYFIEDNLEKSVLAAMTFGVILLSSLVGALSVVLFRRILLFYFNKNTSLILSILFGLSSLVFPYSTVLMGNSFSLFLLLLSFYVLQKDYRQKYVIVGILLGLSFIVDYTSILVILPLIFFIWNKTSKSEKIKLFLSSVLGILPLFVYSFSVFNNPIGFLAYYNFIDPSIYPCTYGKKYFEFCPEPLSLSLKSLPDISLVLAFKILHLFIFPYRGILFYNPFLSFFIVNLFFVFKRNRQLFYFSLFTFLFSIVLVSFYSYWFGGSSFGPRYLVNSLPLMILPIGYLLEDEKFKRRKILIFLFSLSILISTFHMFLSTATNWEGVIVVFDKTDAYLYANWYEKSFFATNFRELNPLYQHYLPAILKNGPRSRILEFLLVEEAPDIRDFRQIPYKEIKILTSPIGFVMLKVPFLSFVIFVFFFILIWNKELKQHKLIGISLRELIIVIALLLLLSRIEFKYMAFGKGWMAQGINETARWSSKIGEIYIFSPIERDVILNISLLNYRGKTLEFYINDNLINTYISPENILEIVKLKKGENKLLLLSKEDCEIPLYVENQLKCSNIVECMKLNTTIFNISFDARCLSFGVVNISIFPLETFLTQNISIAYGSGFYPQEKYTGRWASKKSTLYIYSDEEKNVFFNISVPYYKAEDIKLILNNQSLGDFKVQSLFVTLTLKKGLNKLELYPDKCEIPAYLENNSKDFRCLSFFVRNISLINLDELKEKIYFGSGWYEKEENGRWMSSSSIIYLVRQLNYSKLSLEVESFRQPRKLFIEIDGRSYVFDIPVQRTQKISLILSPSNITKIKLETYPDCKVPGKGDNRCLSIFIRNFSLESLNNIEYLNFFEEEKYNEIKFRWFSTDSKVYVLSNETNIFLLKFNAWTPPNQRRILKIYVNGMKINEYNINDTMMSINLPVVLRKGINEIVFITDSCGYVSNDIRCLGVAISEIQKEDINIENIENFSKGFYGLEMAYGSYFRWMSSEGEIPIFSSRNSSVKLYVKVGWTYFSDRNLNITLNDKLIFADKITKSGKEFSIMLDLVEGWNKIKFGSGCDVPASLEFSYDKRCLSLAFMSLNFLPSSS